MTNPFENQALLDHPGAVDREGVSQSDSGRTSSIYIDHPRGVNMSAQTRSVAPHGPVALLDHPGGNTAVRHQVANGTKVDVYLDRRVANCAGHIVNGNCNSDSTWNPVSSSWWTYPGVTGGSGSRVATVIMTGQTQFPNQGVNSATNWDYVGGRTTSDTALTQWGEPIYGSYSLISTTRDANVYERTYNNCNCGNNNCITNCNCNCVCVCVCVCVCDCHCK